MIAEADSAGEKTSAEPKKPFADAYDWVASLVFAVLFMLLLNLFVFRSITVDGESMMNTLLDKDRVIATNLFYTPSRGDIVVIQADRLRPTVNSLYGEPIIKRVIAVEGDTIRFDFENGIVYLNGEAIKEDYILEPTLRPENRVSGTDYVVPEGYVFVMGDNRNNSTDSRDFRVGMVDTDLIMGKAIFRFAPFDKMGLL
ncbi:MAG: signal peptidase I [Oscillospiraceae bacterium]|nr:signal peptidase I [Oscillospiraceae bacterium]